MAKCNLPKNACKVCMKPVTTKTGLQCQGACRTWMHFNCLNFTPGKIQDIKAGIIRVTCPCPDCTSLSRREYRTDDPSSNYCEHWECPANQIPKCDNDTCPINVGMNAPLSCRNSWQQLAGANGCDNKCGQRYEDDNAADEPGDCCQGASPKLEDTLERMCTTIGQLTNQINTLMTKIRSPAPEEVDCCIKHSQSKNSNCPKSCYCSSKPRC